jgi:Zn-dependent protease
MNQGSPFDQGGGFVGDFRSQRPLARHPMTWSLPLFQFRGIAVRVHAIFLLLVAVELLRSTLPGMPRTLGLPPTLMLVGCMLVVATLHEGIRTAAHRRLGGELAEWLLWPLGGLCNAEAEGTPRQRELAVAWPWLVQLVCGALMAVPLRWETGRWIDGGVPVPWSLDGFRELSLQGIGVGWEVLWLLQWWNLVSLLLQLPPALPLTGGRFLMTWLEPRLGWSEAVRVTARAGIGSAVAMLVLGLAAGLWTLTVLALVLWISSRETIDRVEASDAFAGPIQPPEPRADLRPDKDTLDQAELDRILAKIKASGIESLGWRERRLLKAATRRRQGGDGGSR